MRARKPWFRKSKNAWFVEVDGKQVRLAVGAESEKAAYTAFYKLMAGGKPQVAATGILAATICDLFLDYSQRHHTAESYQHYKHFLEDFCQCCGTFTAVEVKPFNVTKWLDGKTTWKGSKRSAIISVKRAFSWAEQEGLIPTSPIRHVKKPAVNRRTRVITAEEKKQILAAIPDQAFRDFVFAMQETGCRPSEIAAVTAGHCNPALGIWVFEKHKTSGKTGRPRIVYLNSGMVELTTRLIAKNPAGPLFRNRRGSAYSRNAIRCRFRRLRENHPNLAGIVAYSYRHSFATDALIRGVGIAQVAELLGHSGTDMVMRHYGHIADNIEHMRAAAAKATA